MHSKFHLITAHLLVRDVALVQYAQDDIKRETQNGNKLWTYKFLLQTRDFVGKSVIEGLIRIHLDEISNVWPVLHGVEPATKYVIEKIEDETINTMIRYGDVT